MSLTHRLKNRLWQAIAILAPFLPTNQISTKRNARIEELVTDVFAALRNDERKSVRNYIEIAAFQLLHGDVTRIRTHLLPLLSEFDLDIPVAASALLLSNFLLRSTTPAAAVAAVCGDGGHEGAGGGGGGVMAELGVALLPWFSHHTHHVRALASLALKHYSKKSKGGGDGGLTNAALLFMEKNSDVARLHAHLENMFFSGLDVRRMCSAVTVLRPVVAPAGEAHGERYALLRALCVYRTRFSVMCMLGTCAALSRCCGLLLQLPGEAHGERRVVYVQIYGALLYGL